MMLSITELDQVTRCGVSSRKDIRCFFLLLLFNSKLSISLYVNFTWLKDQGAALGFAFTAKTYPWINVVQQNLYGYYRRQSAKTDLETRYNGLLGCNYLVVLCSSFCCRLCRKMQFVHVMQSVKLLSVYLKMPPQVHCNLCRGFPKAFSCAAHPSLCT